MKKFTSIAVCLAAALSVTSAVHAKKIYTWTDEKGVKHYSNTQPPDQVKHGSNVLNSQGVKVESRANEQDRAKIEEQRKAAAAAKIAAEKQAREDRVLLEKYPTEDDVKRGYMQNVELLDEQIRTTTQDIEGRQTSLAKLVTQAGELERANKTVPENIKLMIAQERQQIENSRKFIKQRQAAKVTAKVEYDKDLARYREVHARRNGTATKQ
jgi:hypothetical protein